MNLLYILLLVLGLLALATAFKLPQNFFANEEKRKLFRKKKRKLEKDSVFKT